MVRPRKAAKLTINKNRLSQLPDAILHTIISKLTLKEAVRTSLLSKGWRCIWTSHPNLLFDSVNTLGSSVYSYSISVQQPEYAESNKRLQRCKFIERVDRIMNQRCLGPKVDSFTVHFNLQKDCTSYINRWISSAVLKGVEKVDLDLSDWTNFDVNHGSYQQYIFCFSILFPRGKHSTVKYLQLSSCSLLLIPCSNRLTSLVTVVLRDVSISDQQMEQFLSACSSLERLSLDDCKDLVIVNVVVPSLRLMFLSVENCSRVKSINICAPDLVTLGYSGYPVRFSFKRVPRLAQVFLTFTGNSKVDGVDYALSRLAYDLPHLETLNLVSILCLKTLKLPEMVPKFTNIKHFVLTVFPFEDEDELCWISYILKAFPLLEKLQLNLFSPSFIIPRKGVSRRPCECHHKFVRELEVNGFCGNEHERELLSYLVNNLVGLEGLVVNQCQKVYRGFYNWDYEQASCWYKLSEESIAWVRGAVPESVDLRIIR